MELIKQMFCKKIYSEYKKFKNDMLKQSKEELFGNVYKIEIMINLYEILLEKAESLSERSLWSLLMQPNLLETMYSSWMKKEDGFYRELQQHVEEELPEEEIELMAG